MQRFDLETHRSSVHDKRKDHRCDHCNRSFSQRSNLLTHVRITHQAIGVELLPCPECPKTFKTKSNLKQHMPMHDLPHSETSTMDSSDALATVLNDQSDDTTSAETSS